MAARHGQQHPDPDRPDRAGRPGGQERHPDRRVRARGEARDGKDPVAAVVEACRLRLRPILMTAFAFILGVVPLVIAVGPGAEMRQALGTAVFFGMIGVTVVRPVPDAGVLRGAAGDRHAPRPAAQAGGGDRDLERAAGAGRRVPPSRRDPLGRAGLAGDSRDGGSGGAGDRASGRAVRPLRRTCRRPALRWPPCRRRPLGRALPR